MMNSLLVSKKRSIFADKKTQAFTELILYPVYICKSPNFEDRGRECSPPLILYIEKGEGKGGRLGWVWKDFLFMMELIFDGISSSS